MKALYLDTVDSNTQTELYMLATGAMDTSTVTGRKDSLTNPFTLDNTYTVLKPVMESYAGPMVAFMKDSSLMVHCRAMASSPGLVERNMLEPGNETKWTDLVFLDGKMAENTMGNIRIIINMGMVYILTQEEKSTKEIGQWANYMDQEECL